LSFRATCQWKLSHFSVISKCQNCSVCFVDAVTVVLYHTVEAMSCMTANGEAIEARHYVIAFFKFFASSIGGILMGVLFGVLSSSLTKYTVHTRGRNQLVNAIHFHLPFVFYLSILPSYLRGFSKPCALFKWPNLEVHLSARPLEINGGTSFESLARTRMNSMALRLCYPTWFALEI